MYAPSLIRYITPPTAGHGSALRVPEPRSALRHRCSGPSWVEQEKAGRGRGAVGCEADPLLVSDHERALHGGEAEAIEHLDRGSRIAEQARTLLRRKTYSPKKHAANVEA